MIAWPVFLNPQATRSFISPAPTPSSPLAAADGVTASSAATSTRSSWPPPISWAWIKLLISANPGGGGWRSWTCGSPRASGDHRWRWRAVQIVFGRRGQPGCGPLRKLNKSRSGRHENHAVRVVFLPANHRQLIGGVQAEGHPRASVALKQQVLIGLMDTTGSCVNHPAGSSL